MTALAATGRSPWEPRFDATELGSSYFGPLPTLSAGCTTVQRDYASLGHGRAVLCGRGAWSGVHEVEYAVLEVRDRIGFGVISKPVDKGCDREYPNVWSQMTHINRCHARGELVPGAAFRVFPKFGTLTLHVDMDAGTGSYSINGKRVGLLWSDLKGHTVWPIVFIRDARLRVVATRSGVEFAIWIARMRTLVLQGRAIGDDRAAPVVWVCSNAPLWAFACILRLLRNKLL